MLCCKVAYLKSDAVQFFRSWQKQWYQMCLGWRKFPTIVNFFFKNLLLQTPPRLCVETWTHSSQLISRQQKPKMIQVIKISDRPNRSCIPCQRIWWQSCQNEHEVISPQHFGVLTPNLVHLTKTITWGHMSTFGTPVVHFMFAYNFCNLS